MTELPLARQQRTRNRIVLTTFGSLGDLHPSEEGVRKACDAMEVLLEHRRSALI